MRAHACKRPAPVTTTFSNSGSGHLRELRLYAIKAPYNLHPPLPPSWPGLLINFLGLQMEVWALLESRAYQRGVINRERAYYSFIFRWIHFVTAFSWQTHGILSYFEHRQNYC